MLRKIGVTLLYISSLLTTNAFATTEHLFTQGLSVEYELPPHDPQVFSNIFFWEISAVCTVISDFDKNSISIRMLRKTGSVNGIQLSAGDVTQLSAQPGDKLYIVAPPGAKVELTNLEDHPVKASCTTANNS